MLWTIIPKLNSKEPLKYLDLVNSLGKQIRARSGGNITINRLPQRALLGITKV